MRHRRGSRGSTATPAACGSTLLVTLLMATAAAGQAVPPAAQQASGGDARALELALGEVAPEVLLRVSTPGYRLEGARVSALGADSVTLESNDVTLSFAFADIRGVEVRDSHWLQGMLWGGVSGAVLGSVVGVMVGSWNCQTNDECRTAENEGAWTWGIVGGAVGGLTGFVVGRHSFYWRPIFP